MTTPLLLSDDMTEEELQDTRTSVQRERAINAHPAGHASESTEEATS